MFICHPEPQLKRCYSEPQLKEYHVLKFPISSHNSRDTFWAQLKEHQQSHLWSITRSLVDHAYKTSNPTLQQQNRLAGGTRATRRCRFQIAWRVMRTTRRQVPQNVYCYQVPPGRTLMTARRHMLSASLEFYLLPSGSHYAVRRYTRTSIVLIFLHLYATANPP